MIYISSVHALLGTFISYCKLKLFYNFDASLIVSLFLDRGGVKRDGWISVVAAVFSIVGSMLVLVVALMVVVVAAAVVVGLLFPLKPSPIE